MRRWWGGLAAGVVFPGLGWWTTSWPRSNPSWTAGPASLAVRKSAQGVVTRNFFIKSMK